LNLVTRASRLIHLCQQPVCKFSQASATTSAHCPSSPELVNYSDTQLTSSGLFMNRTRIWREGGGMSEPNEPPLYPHLPNLFVSLLPPGPP